MPCARRAKPTVGKRKMTTRLAKQNLPKNPKLRKKVTAQRGAKKISQTRRPLRGKRAPVRRAR